MTIVSKVVLGFVFIAAFAFLWFSARTLKTHEVWRTAYEKVAASKISLEKEKRQLQFGGSERKGPNGEDLSLGKLKAEEELYNATIHRGRVWRNAHFDGADPLGLRFRIELPAPHTLAVGDILYIFDARPVADGGQYLGEFTVKAAPEGQPTIVVVPMFLPSQQRPQLVARFQTKLEASLRPETPFTLYDTLPQDRHDLYAGYTDQQLEQILPAETVDEFKRDGKPAAADDPEDRVATDDKGDRVYRRPLRDYFKLYAKEFSDLVVNTDEIAGYKNDLASLQSVNTALEAEIEARKAEKAVVDQAISAAKAEVEAVSQHQTKLDEELATLKKQVEESYARLKQQESELAKLYEAGLKKAETAAPPPAPAGGRTTLLPEAATKR